MTSIFTCHDGEVVINESQSYFSNTFHDGFNFTSSPDGCGTLVYKKDLEIFKYLICKLEEYKKDSIITSIRTPKSQKQRVEEIIEHYRFGEEYKNEYWRMIIIAHFMGFEPFSEIAQNYLKLELEQRNQEISDLQELYSLILQIYIKNPENIISEIIESVHASHYKSIQEDIKKIGGNSEICNIINEILEKKENVKKRCEYHIHNKEGLLVFCRSHSPEEIKYILDNLDEWKKYYDPKQTYTLKYTIGKANSSIDAVVENQTLFFYCLYNGCFDICDILLEHNSEFINMDDMIIKYSDEEYKGPPICILLNLLHNNKEKYDPLFQYGYFDRVEYLIKRGVNLDLNYRKWGEISFTPPRVEKIPNLNPYSRHLTEQYRLIYSKEDYTDGFQNPLEFAIDYKDVELFLLLMKDGNMNENYNEQDFMNFHIMDELILKGIKKNKYANIIS